MTGFARAEGFEDGYRWAWEVKSVNARGLDIRCRLPTGYDSLDATARGAVAGYLKRGNVSVSLQVTRPDQPTQARINREMLDQLIALHRELGDRIAPEPPRIETLLAVRGVVELVEGESDPDNREQRETRIAASLDQALEALVKSRNDEGNRLAKALTGHLGDIESLCTAAEGTAALDPEAQRRRLADQVAALLDAEPALPEERLAQEAALLISKADVREELDRLGAHIQAARDLMAEGDAIGRRLDFLCQEFNREANTLCAKSPDIELTRIGLDLKAAVERFREQVQNIE